MPWIFNKSDILSGAGIDDNDFSGILNTDIVAATLSCSLVFLFGAPLPPLVCRKRIGSADIYRESDVRHAHEKK